MNVDNENPTKYIRLALVDSVNNTDEMSTEKVDKLLLSKENFLDWFPCDPT